MTLSRPWCTSVMYVENRFVMSIDCEPAQPPTKPFQVHEHGFTELEFRELAHELWLPRNRRRHLEPTEGFWTFSNMLIER